MAAEKMKNQLHGSKIKHGPTDKLKTIKQATNLVQLDHTHNTKI
jgi:hypothetical protein